MKKVIATIVIAGSLAVPAYAADTYTIDPNHTFPIFEVNHLGFSSQLGRFNKTSGSITLDMAAKKGNVNLVIESTSIDMGFPLWD